MTVRQWMRTPKGYVVIVMMVYLLIASIGYQTLNGILNGIVAVGVSLVVDILCSILERRKRVFPDGSIVTGLIIALILSGTTHWTIAAATSAIAILSKHLLVYKKKPIFNPAVFGLFLSVLLFHTGQSWWGAFGDLPAWMILLLLIGGYLVTNRVHKFPQVFSFLSTYFLLLWMMGILNVGDAWDALRAPFINAALFFAFFMLTDPPTSPPKDKDQVRFGVITALAGALVYACFGGLTYLFIGLMAGNIYYLLKSWQTKNGKSHQVVTDKVNSILSRNP